VASSATGERDCSIGNCTDTRGKFGSTTVALSGLEVYLADYSYQTDKKKWFNETLPKTCLYGWAGKQGTVVKVDRTIWNLGFDSSRQDPFYLAAKILNYDNNASRGETIIYQ
jgi:hypothetical protein